MSKQPPNDDELLGVIFEQLQDAMSETELEEDAEIQEELMTGIRHSLQALFGSSVNFKPQVTVMEGGKTEETDADSKRPELHFAPQPEEDPVSEETSVLKPDVQVRVFKSGEGKGNTNRVRALRSGQISVQDGGEQQILYGITNQLYRVYCVDGLLAVYADQNKTALLHPGQSIDVEAKQITVKGEESSTGSYDRVQK